MKLMQAYKPLCISLLLLLIMCTTAHSQQSTITYYHNDILGNPIATSNAQGEIIWRKSYRPYGSELEAGGAAARNNRISYTGHTLDKDLGLVYAGLVTGKKERKRQMNFSINR